MREILFRGKSIRNGEWIEGGLIKVAAPCAIYHLIFGPEFAFSAFGTKSLKHSAVNPSTIGQYTGLTDCIGTKIFEGDILRYFNSEEHSIYSVIWKYKRWLVQMCEEYDVCPDDLDEDFCKDAYVIGNIYDNPELLEGGERNG